MQQCQCGFTFDKSEGLRICPNCNVDFDPGREDRAWLNVKMTISNLQFSDDQTTALCETLDGLREIIEGGKDV